MLVIYANDRRHHSAPPGTTRVVVVVVVVNAAASLPAPTLKGSASAVAPVIEVDVSSSPVGGAALDGITER